LDSPLEFDAFAFALSCQQLLQVFTWIEDNARHVRNRDFCISVRRFGCHYEDKDFLLLAPHNSITFQFSRYDAYVHWVLLWVGLGISDYVQNFAIRLNLLSRKS